MARKFTEAGLASVALTGDDAADDRSRVLDQLQAGKLRCVFSVEVLGEGVDVPDVDCLLLLRPDGVDDACSPSSSDAVFGGRRARAISR